MRGSDKIAYRVAIATTPENSGTSSRFLPRFLISIFLSAPLGFSPPHNMMLAQCIGSPNLDQLQTEIS